MKKIIILVLSVAYLSVGFSQKEKIDEQWYAVPVSKKVNLNLKFGSNIEVQPTTQTKLGIKTIITYKNEADLKIHQMQVEENKNELRIVADMNKEYLNSKSDKWNCWDCEKTDCQCYRIAFVVMVPKDVELNLETISGNIEIPQLKNTIQAKSISGFIDVGIGANAQRQLNFKSVTGEIFTDFDLTLDKNSTPFSKKLNAPLNGGGPMLALETISGDIFFRKK
ncbi:MAG: hypothetical protein DHS20C18_19800 [Saprospiraceae bacterium]|nr:MAG: hypothetical protein DHS20C18_19800 [Saprospiraceae bacterium]